MDMPNVDLYRLLMPPAYVEHYKKSAGIENLLHIAQSAIPIDPSCDSSFQKKSEVLKELMRPLRIEYFFDETRDFYYGLMFDPANSNGSPFAIQVYFVNANNQPTKIHKVVYPKTNKTLVIRYKDSSRNFSTDGIIDWTKPARVNCIEIDSGENKVEFDGVFQHFRKIKERRKDEGKILTS